MADAVGGVQGTAFVTLKVNGTAVPSASNVIKQMTFIEGTYTFPQVLLDFYDMHHMFDGAYALVDGTQLEVTVGADSGKPDTYVFRLVGSRKYTTQGVDLVHAAGILDKSPFILNTEAYSKKGNATDVLKDVCSKHDIKFVTEESSDDTMTWVSLNESPFRFCEKIERQMWLGENTLPHISLFLDGSLHLVDMLKLLDQEAKFTFNYQSTTQTSNDITVMALREKSIAGIMNFNQNYGRTTLVPNSQTGTVDPIKSTSMKAKDVNISSDVKSSLAVTNIKHEHIDPISDGAGANVHKNWFKARDQWDRLASTFTEMVRVMVRGKDDIPLFSTVQLNAGNLSGGDFQTNVKLSGKWIVTGKTSRVSNAGFYVAYLLSRNFVGDKGSTGLVDDNTGNKAMNVQPTVANPTRPTQFNMNVAGGINSVIAKQNSQLNSMFDSFQQSSKSFAFPELLDKYGPDCDALDAFMSEFNMATLINSMCGALSPLEKLTLSSATINGTQILNTLDSRMGQCEGLLTSYASDINGLIAKGDIPESYASPPTINAPCNLNSVSDLNSAIADSYPDKCMDAFTLDSLHAPTLDLTSYLRQLEEWMRKFLCAFGDGTIDGSADTKTTPVGIRADYK